MSSLVKELVDAGIHFGSRSTNWNPKMGPYIFGKRQKMHIIDVKQTIKGLLLARKFLTKTVADGKDVLFVGTKRQARAIIEEHCSAVEMHYVSERWLGGTLTNFRTIRERLKRLEELEALEESGQINNYSKKMEATLNREKSKISRNLGGIRNMTKMPGAIVVIDVNHETNALKEARKLGIPTVCLIDTDSDPDLADIPIPGNDDSLRSIDVIVKSLCAAVAEGKTARAQQNKGKEDAEASDATPGNAGNGEPEKKRRGSRPSRFSASAEGAGEGDAPSTDPEAPTGDAAPTAADAAAPEQPTAASE